MPFLLSPVSAPHASAASSAPPSRPSPKARATGLIGFLGSALLLGACSTPSPPPEAAPASQPRATARTTAPQASSKRPVSPTPAPAPAANARFGWPAQGPVLGRFDGSRNKGIDIGGQAGDPVLASADGRVVFVGSQLRGYGQMLVVKHDDTFITAYAHTRRILVKEKEEVRKGQKIAEMGSSGTDRVKLHFEIRRQGVAVNPQPYLDGRQR